MIAYIASLLRHMVSKESLLSLSHFKSYKPFSPVCQGFMCQSPVSVPLVHAPGCSEASSGRRMQYNGQIVSFPAIRILRHGKAMTDL